MAPLLHRAAIINYATYTYTTIGLFVTRELTVRLCSIRKTLNVCAWEDKVP